MSMFGIDVSVHQAGIDIKATGAQFAIVKATDGTRFVDKTCDGFVQQCKAAGIPWGFYHFANGIHKSSMKDQAKYFVDNCRNYFGEGIPFLDWEDSKEIYGGAVKKYGPAAAKEWLDEVYRLTGVRPIIYMSKSVTREYDWSEVAKDYGLWCAQYATTAHVGIDMNPWTDSNGFGAWGGCAIYQYSGTGRINGYNDDLDLDIAYMDASGWSKYANPSGTSEPQPSPQPSAPSGSTLDLAIGVINGNYGNGDERRSALGTRYQEVQDFINHVYSATAQTLAEEVKAGRYGNGDTRKQILGNRYSDVQAVVNGSSARYYTVCSGDTLSGIGAKLGVSWQAIARANGIGSPYTIYPGQKLMY